MTRPFIYCVALLCIVGLFSRCTCQVSSTTINATAIRTLLTPTTTVNPPHSTTVLSQPSNTHVTALQIDTTQPTRNHNPSSTINTPTPRTRLAELLSGSTREPDYHAVFPLTTVTSDQLPHRHPIDISTPNIASSIQELFEATGRKQLPIITQTIDEESREAYEYDEAYLDQERLRLWCNERLHQLEEAKPNTMDYFFYFLYILLFIIGISGNSLTVRAMTKKRKKSNIDLFILSLALNDIIVCIFNIPITPLYTLYYQRWIFGSTLCYVFTFAMCFSTYTSVFILIAIAMVRYQMVVYPHCRWMTRRTVLVIIGLVWILGLSLTLPYMINIHLFKDNCGIYYCNETWPTIQGKLTFSLITLVSKSMLPSLVVFFSYAAIYRKLKCRQKLHERHKALLSIAYPSAFPLVKSMNGGHPAHLKALPASNTVPYELNAAQQQQQLDKKLLIMNGATRGAESLKNHLPSYLLETIKDHQPTSLSNQMVLTNGGAMLDKYNSVSDIGVGSDLGQVFGDPYELCTLLARKNSADLVPDRNTSPALISHQTTALVDGLVDGFVVQSSTKGHQQTPKRPATSLGFLNRVVSATNLFKNEHLVRSPVECQLPLKTNTILAIRENQIREKNQRLYQASRKLVIVVALFVACYLPVDIINVLYDYQYYMDLIRSNASTPFNSYYFVSAHLVNCASVCINPILYAWMSDNYRQELKNILPNWLIRKLFRD